MTTESDAAMGLATGLFTGSGLFAFGAGLFTLRAWLFTLRTGLFSFEKWDIWKYKTGLVWAPDEPGSSSLEVGDGIGSPGFLGLPGISIF